MQSYAEEDGVIVFDHQGLFSSSNSERQSEFLEPKVLYLFVLEIDKNLYLHQCKTYWATSSSAELPAILLMYHEYISWLI